VEVFQGVLVLLGVVGSLDGLVPQGPLGVVEPPGELVPLGVGGFRDGMVLRMLGVHRLGRRGHVHSCMLGRHERGDNVGYDDDEDEHHGDHNDGYKDWSECCMGKLGCAGP